MRRSNVLLVTAAVLVAGAVALAPQAAGSIVPTAPVPVPRGPALDARAAAADTPGRAGAAGATVARAAAGVAANSVAVSFFSGAVGPGARQHWFLSDAGVNIAYHVGFSPADALPPRPTPAPADSDPAPPCTFELVDRWYDRLPTGERQFHYTVRNATSVTCGTTIMVAAVDAPTVASTGRLLPGQTRDLARLDVGEQGVMLIGLTPGKVVAAGGCQFTVLRSWYRRTARELGTAVDLLYTVQNIGDTTCAAAVEIGSDPISHTLSPRTLAPGAQVTFRWNNANPVTAVHLPGVLPDRPGCQMEITRSWYRRVFNADGAFERELILQLRNAGIIECAGRTTLARI